LEERYCPITELAKIGVMLIKQSIIVKKHMTEKLPMEKEPFRQLRKSKRTV